MGAKESSPPISNDRKKLRAFYTYEVPDDKLVSAEQRVSKSRYKFFARGLVFGFVFQLIIYNANIYDAINRRATTRRLSKVSLMQRPS